MNYASTCEKLSMQPHWVYRTLPWSFSLPPVAVQLGWEAQPCRCNVPYFCRNCIDCDQQSKTVHDAFMQFMYHTCMATSWPKTKNLTIDLITPHNPLHKKNIGSRSKWKSLLKDLCNRLLCFSQSSAQKDHQKWTQMQIPLQNLKLIQIWSPYQASKTTQINTSLYRHHHCAVNFSAWQLHTERSPAKESSACNCPKTLKKS